jgi:RNA polymerase sigma factor (sigma-70 family)
MAEERRNAVIERIRSLAAAPSAEVRDSDLLGQFIARRDDAAFEALLRRHGPMVLRVARRILGHDADAEDVFQATFLLLSRAAHSIRKPEAVAGWLHGVAHRLALSARARRGRRQIEEQRAARARPTESAWHDLEETLHEVIARLPEKYRTPLVYCYLEGWTQEEVARQLSVPLGTVHSWLARGREMLRARLIRRGISLSAAGVSAAFLASSCASAMTVPEKVLRATLKASRLFGAGESAAALGSSGAATLVRKGMIDMMLAKLKNATLCLFAVSLLMATAGLAAQRFFAYSQERAEEPPAGENQGKEQAAEKPGRVDTFGDPLPPGAVARLGTVRFRHEQSPIWQFAISPDGSTVGAAAGRSVALWDAATGRPLRRFVLPDNVKCLAFAPDSKSVAVGAEDYVVHLFDLASGREVRRFVGHKPNDQLLYDRGIRGVFFIEDGRTLVSWGNDHTVRKWDVQTGKELSRFSGKYVLGVSPDGKFAVLWKETGRGNPLPVVGGGFGSRPAGVGPVHSVVLWNLETGKESPLAGGPDMIQVVGGLSFSPDSKRVAVACGDKLGQVKVWELKSGKEIATWMLSPGQLHNHALAFSPDGKSLASVGGDLFVRLWDVGSKKERSGKRLRDPVHHLAFSPDGKTLLSSGDGNENPVRLWDVATWRERLPAEGPRQAIGAVAFSPDGKRVVSCSGDRMCLWNAATGKVVRVLEPNVKFFTGVPFSDVAFSADGKVLVCASHDGRLRVLDANTGEEQRHFQAVPDESYRVDRIALSPKGNTLATWGGPSWPVIHLWDLTTGALRGTLKAPSRLLTPGLCLKSLCFSHDGKTLYAGHGTHLTVLRWNVATQKELPGFGKHDGILNGIALSPDDRSLAAVTQNGTLYLWETASGQPRLIVKDAGHATSVAFSPDGRLLALANSGDDLRYTEEGSSVRGAENREQVRLVRVADGKVIHRFRGHVGGVMSLSFSPDGRTLASGGHDTTVLVWDVAGSIADAAKTTPLAPAKLAELWRGLNGNAAEAYGCMTALISSPAQTVAFLDSQLKPVAGVVVDFAALRVKLESDDFKEREKATRELKGLRERVEPDLVKALQENPSLEPRRRLERLLAELGGPEDFSGQRLRTLRAIEVLERIGDKLARELLQKLATGATGAWQTEKAKASLRRLER